MCVIDLHTHILPGVDDGARTLTEAIELARHSVADGVTAVVATGPTCRTTTLGHPERNPEVQDRPSRLAEAVAAGALVQVTAGSLCGDWRRSAMSAARRLSVTPRSLCG